MQRNGQRRFRGGSIQTFRRALCPDQVQDVCQNLQKGSRRMSDMLEQESMEAWDERKRKARVLGEAAATKLLLPMAMMLMVVMAVIMIPAFLSFYT